MTPQRIIVIEPNLINPFGHVIDFPFALEKECQKRGIRYRLVSNRFIKKETLKLVKNVAPMVTQICFESLEDNGKTFYQDLLHIDARFRFTDSDLIIIPTCYTNQILGVGKYLETHTTRVHFVFLFHQLFPPLLDFYDTLERRYQNFCFRRLQKYFRVLSKHDKRVSLWSAPSHELAKKLTKLAGRKVGTLPLIFDSSIPKKTNSKESKNGLTFGFLGDGRYEKGLLLLLNSVRHLQSQKHRFVIQLIGTRGYSKEALSRSRMFREELSAFHNIQFINGALPPDEFDRTLDSLDALILPYHPQSYDKRVSGIFVQGTLSGKPAIVSSGTWMAKEVKRHGFGKVFLYDPNSYERPLLNLTRAIGRFSHDYPRYKKNAVIASKTYQAFHNASVFLNSIFTSV